MYYALGSIFNTEKNENKKKSDMIVTNISPFVLSLTTHIMLELWQPFCDHMATSMKMKIQHTEDE